MSETTATTQPVVVLRGIRKSYGPVEVLHGVDLVLHAGKARALVGENGAGKSTILGVIAGKSDDWTGDYLLRGVPVRFSSIRAAQHGGIALIHQETTSLPTMTVAENVMAGRMPRRFGLIDRKALHRRAAAALATLGIELDLEAPASSLGAAELQLVDIARALLAEPAVLLLDEPTASLPAEDRDRLFTVVRTLLSQGTSVVFISHHLDEIAAICDDVTVMRDGAVVADVPAASADAATITELMIGRELAAVDRAGAGTPGRGAPVLTVTGLDDGESVLGVDLEVAAGEIVGVTGLLGAGQKGLVSALLGVTRSRGTMTLRDQTWRPTSVHQAVAAGIGILTEDRKADGLILDEPIYANLGLASTLRRGWARYDRKAERVAARELIETLSIKCSSEAARVGSLSGGNQQKVALGKWMREPRALLVLDEPTRGVDVGAKALLHERIRALAADGAAVLLVSSDLPEIVALAERAVVMHRGRVAARFDHPGFDQQDLLQAASGPPPDLHDQTRAPHLLDGTAP